MESFSNLLEEIKSLSIDEKIEIRNLLDKYLIEERREEIYNSYIQSMDEFREGKMTVYSDISKLKSNLNNG